MNNPLISIIIPSYNHADYIEKTIKSVLNQDYENIEIIIVDDGSSDNSINIIKGQIDISPKRIVLITQKNGGICKALNRGVLESSGDILGFLASDDLMEYGRIKKELIYFEDNENLKVLYGNGKFFKDNKKFGEVHKIIKRYLNKGIAETKDYIINNCPAMFIQAMLIKKDFIELLGGFDEETGSDDWSLNIRIFNSLENEKELFFFDNTSFLYRLHDYQNHRHINFMTPMKKKVVRKYFTLEGRSKYICEDGIKRIIYLLLHFRIKAAAHRFHSIKNISFKNGIPIICSINLIFKIPSYLLNKFK